MDNYNEQKEATTNKVRFSISPDGRVEFDSQGLEEWQLSEALHRVAEQGKEQRQATQKLKEVTVTSDLVMHGIAFSFALIVVFGATFTVSRVISGAVHSNQGVQNVQR